MISRGEFVIELMGLWEKSAEKLTNEGYTKAAEEVRTAVKVLEKTYSQVELDEPRCQVCGGPIAVPLNFCLIHTPGVFAPEG